MSLPPSDINDSVENQSTSKSAQIPIPIGKNRSSVGDSSPVLSEKTSLWLRRADQLFLGTILIALVILLALFRWRLSGGGQAEIEIISQHPREYYYAIDINHASWVEWSQLDGIGEKLARRIVEDRQERGAFRTIEDVSRVRGVGLKLLEKLRPFLTCRDQSSTGTLEQEPSIAP